MAEHPEVGTHRTMTANKMAHAYLDMAGRSVVVGLLVYLTLVCQLQDAIG